MFVAIIDQRSPAGTVAVRQFQVASSAAEALDQFVHDFTPPLDPADWLAVDTGWSEYQKPPGGLAYEWAYDFDNPGLVQQLLPETDRLEALGLVQVIPGPLADPSGPTTPYAWEDMGFLSVNLDFFYPDLNDAQFVVWGRHKTTQVGANTAQVRLAAGGVAYSDEVDLPDTGGDWQNFSINTRGYTLPGDRKLFVVQTKLRNASTTVELRGVSIAMMRQKY
jgi:hypothetical protein